ncbi:MAG: hypothetical protein AB7V42_14160 [Thermoleophilia bacterium]
MDERARPVDAQMLADWAAVGLRRLEAHLARHAAFRAFLDGRNGVAPAPSDGDRDRVDPGASGRSHPIGPGPGGPGAVNHRCRPPGR